MLLNRAGSVYLGLVALSVAVQFTVWTIYAQSSDRASDTANNIWNVLGWCQLAGLAMILVTTFKEKRRHDDDPLTSTRQWLTANRIFYSTLLLTLAFLPNWFAARWGEPPDQSAFWMVWYIIDTVLPVVFTVEALRLWKIR